MIINTSSLQLFHDGSNSLLYYQEDVANQQHKVIKVLKDEFASPNRIANFFNEYEIAKELELKGVPKYYGKETLEGKPAIVMGYVEGKPLRILFQKERPNLKEFLNIAIGATEILSGIHQNHIIHKDINSNNVIFNPKTLEVSIIDFGISSKFDLKQSNLKNPDVLEGTLAYISPEQTGRMNRIVDYRTDLYSLGVTFYELLTGQLPFESKDSMELVHCHIARKPLAVCEINTEIPIIISEIVMRLLEKSASDRYQSAYGLKMDLKRCLDDLELKGMIELFEIGQKDYSEKLQIPQKLYGCEEETSLLIQAFERVSEGAVELMLVSGYAGVGKSSLVNEIHRPITERRGYFIKGKHDQYQKNIPYSGLIQAFNDFVDQILTESPERIAKWKTKILKAIGSNGGLLIDVIPNLRLIIGSQPSVDELSPVEAANRFNYVFRKFIEILSQEDHPLVIFIDDLQWADSATLNAIKNLMSDDDNHYLLLVGAYRDNEVNQTHPLSFMIDDMQKKQSAINILHLNNLDKSHVYQIVAETLRCPVATCKSLGDLIYDKTQGNAFFVNQFLKSLFEEGLLSFDIHQYAWAWDVPKIQKKNITNNVVDLMASKIEKLPGNTRDLLQLASCIGDKFDLATLSHIYVRSQIEAFHTLWVAVEEGLIIPLDDNYKIIPALEESGMISVECHFQFLHDRVQQAAYQLIPDMEKKRIHYQIGTLLLENTPEEAQKDRIFDIVNHFNAGQDYVRRDEEKRQVASLNRIAGEKAKSATAYEASFDYLFNSLNLLGSNCWENNYQEAWYTHTHAAEIAYLIGQKDEMERLVGIVLTNAKNVLDKVKAFEIQIQAHISNSEMGKAVRVARTVLKMLGVRFPRKATKLHVIKALVDINLKLRGKSAEELLNLPKMEDLKARAIARILSANAIAAYLSDKNLYVLFILKQIRISLKYGNAYTTSSAYTSFAMIHSAIMKKYHKGYFYGELGMKLTQKRNAKKLVPRQAMLFQAMIRPWVEHASTGLGALIDGHRKGMEIGDFEYGLHDALQYMLISVYTGKPLKPLFETGKKLVASAKQVNQIDPMNVLMVQTQFVENLVEPCTDYSRLIGTCFNEVEKLPKITENNELTVLACVYIFKMKAAYLFDEYHLIDEYMALGRKYVQSIVGTVGDPMLTCYHALFRCKLILEEESEDPKKDLKYILAELKKMKTWVKTAPMNFTHRISLVEAELACYRKEYGKAEELYNQAVNQAKENNYMNDEAIALERFAEYWIRRDNEMTAGMYYKKSYLVYQKWGAVAKLEHMKGKHYELLLPDEMPDLQTTVVDMVDLRGSKTTTFHTTRRHSTRTSTMGTTTGRSTSMLDFGSLIKASHAISEEVNLDKMLNKMLQICMENAGAERAVFIRHDGQNLKILAEIHPENAKGMAINIPVAQSNAIPSSMVHYVARTKKPIVLGNASTDSTYSFDSYIQKNSPKSVLCHPVLNKGELSGIIYLENNLAANAFTDDRLEVMDLLSAQIAISIENAILYNNLEQKVAERTQKLNESNAELQEKNSKITDSIRYAQTIQKAFLPTSSQLGAAFSDYFLIYHPKDIVSGDFYWLNEVDDTVFIAVADCTGHGVPGAFMSMIGEASLNDIVNQKKIYDPALMLEMLNVGIRAGLKQEETDNDDGMDVGLCAITKQTNGKFLVEFAGAKRPLYFVKDGRLAVLKGDNKEIGGFLKRKEKNFVTQRLELERGDLLFLTTDGFADQSNQKLKKLGSTLFMDLLEANSKHPMKKQRQLLEKILNIHMDGTEQRDDITVLGVRL